MIVSGVDYRKLSDNKTYFLKGCIFIKAFMTWAMAFQLYFSSCMYVVVEAKYVFVSRLFQYPLRSEPVC